MTGSIEQAYREEADQTLRGRLVAMVVLYLVFVGVGCWQEALVHPSAAQQVTWAYTAHVSACVLALGLAFLPGSLPWQRVIAGGLGVAMVTILNTYNGIAGFGAERTALTLSAMLNALLVMVPQGWPGQAAAGVASLVGFLVASPQLEAPDTQAFAVLVLVAAATTTTIGAWALERYRFRAFVRAAEQAEEAAIAAGLTHVAETLYQHLDQPDLLARVNRLAVELLECDVSASFLWDPAAVAFPLSAQVGMTPPALAQMGLLEQRWLDARVRAALRPGAVLEIADSAAQDLVPPDVLAGVELASALITPISRRGEPVAVLVHGRRTRPGPFSVRQHRLALGIAHTAAVALENARLIVDLRSANRLKSEFVATMSHELRTPLNVIMGYAELLGDDALGALEPSQRDTVGRIRRSAVELLELINATLDLGRLDAGRETVDLGPVDLTRLFAELEVELAALVAPGVRLRWTVEPTAAQLTTDRTKLKTIVKNLVGNALKFTPGGNVEVCARNGDGAIELVVRDTGIGIAAEHVTTIFEMFRQVDGSSTRRYGGVGLGLYIVRRLSELLGGRVSVESVVGQGSTFTVRLPQTP